MKASDDVANGESLLFLPQQAQWSSVEGADLADGLDLPAESSPDGGSSGGSWGFRRRFVGSGPIEEHFLFESPGIVIARSSGGSCRCLGLKNYGVACLILCVDGVCFRRPSNDLISSCAFAWFYCCLVGSSSHIPFACSFLIDCVFLKCFAVDNRSINWDNSEEHSSSPSLYRNTVVYNYNRNK